MDQKVRVRFAPSPTGYLHVGGLRAALFNWLYAHHNNGAFLLRIEDTDRDRSTQEYIDSIIGSLDWTDIKSPEPILIQSSRVTEHLDLINKLLADGKAYKCFCAPKDQDKSSNLESTEDFSGYNRKCRTLTPDACKQAQASGASYVVRFKIPDNLEDIKFNDLIRGQISISSNQLDDFVILRSDNTPTYNFVVVADDAFMGVTHILRGEDHISNTPKQILLYDALELKAPEFGHLPLILGPDGTRLSKRHGATSVNEFKISGYLPDALCNYLVRLGWSHGDQEIFSREELIKFFSLDHVGSKSAIFDIDKLNWINNQYIKNTEAQVLAEYISKNIDINFKNNLEDWSDSQITDFIDLYKDRCNTLVQLVAVLISLYKGLEPSKDLVKVWSNNQTQIALKSLVDKLEGLSDFTKLSISSTIKELSKTLSLKMSDIGQPLRLALTGTDASPSIFDLISILGKKESITRINRFLNLLA